VGKLKQETLLLVLLTSILIVDTACFALNNPVAEFAYFLLFVPDPHLIARRKIWSVIMRPSMVSHAPLAARA
jgi:hypothetical protein